MPGMVEQKQKLSGLSTETFTDKHTLLSFPRCFDGAVSPPLFHISCGGCCLGSMAASVSGEEEVKSEGPVYGVFPRVFLCVCGGVVERERECVCVCLLVTHIWISLLSCPELMSLLKQQSNIAGLQMMLRKGQCLCGSRESILCHLVVRSVDHLAPIFISVSRMGIIMNLKIEV